MDREHVSLPSLEEMNAFLDRLSPTRKRQLLARIYTEEESRRTQWLCKLPLCDGTPHLGMPVPHARANQRFREYSGKIGTIIMAGRGYGKTRTGAETIRDRVLNGKSKKIALIARTHADLMRVMVGGPSGVLNVFPEWQRPTFNKNEGKISFHNGAVAHCFSSEKPDALRGPEHDFIWGDEMSTWRDMYSVMYNALFGLRVGDNPQMLLTGTPRPTADMRRLLKGELGEFHVVRGTTYENMRNLPDLTFGAIVKQFEGTRTGRQELNGELLEDVEGALLSVDHFDTDKFRPDKPQTDITRIVVAVDPAVTNETKSDYTGIVVVATDDQTHRGYVLHSEKMKESPEKCMRRAIALYHQYYASAVVAEVNNGGKYVRTVIHQLDKNVNVVDVTASVGKYARAEPVAALYEQGRISHLPQFDNHAELETEWTTWVPPGTKDADGMVIPTTGSPDLMDACVWGLTYLMLGNAARIIRPAKTFSHR